MCLFIMMLFQATSRFLKGNDFYPHYTASAAVLSWSHYLLHLGWATTQCSYHIFFKVFVLLFDSIHVAVSVHSLSFLHILFSSMFNLSYNSTSSLVYLLCLSCNACTVSYMYLRTISQIVFPCTAFRSLGF